LENPGERGHLKTKGIDGNNIKRGLKEIGLAYVEWIHLAQDRV
jgi:hypothetical protein